MVDVPNNKSQVRQQLRDAISALSEQERHARSVAACSLVTHSAEFSTARVIMLFLPMAQEIDTSSIALKAWQTGKTVVVPKVSWAQRRMLPVEINSLTTGLTVTGPGVREPDSGKPVPVDMIDLVIVPGLGFSPDGQRIGRGMGFYDRFLAQPDFIGIACGLAFEEQVIPRLPVLDHDMPLSMLVTNREIRRFASRLIQS